MQQLMKNVTVRIDTTPTSISDLQNTTGATWINWTWTNPSDNDFAYTMVYLNGVFKTNTYITMRQGLLRTEIGTYTNVHFEVSDGHLTDSEDITITVHTGYPPNEMPITVFDTHHGGYPSIMGTHFGNFTPFHDLTVSRLYTYSCPGTSGHSEHIVFYGYEKDEKIAEANWSGYQPFTDYHYIIFNTPLLYAGKTYRYRIKTDSYQIHHNQSIATPDGILRSLLIPMVKSTMTKK